MAKNRIVPQTVRRRIDPLIDFIHNGITPPEKYIDTLHDVELVKCYLLVLEIQKMQKDEEDVYTRCSRIAKYISHKKMTSVEAR